MSDSRILRANERIKALSTMMFNLGSGLLAAAAVKLYVDPEIDASLVVWAIVAFILIWIGWMILSLLESES